MITPLVVLFLTACGPPAPPPATGPPVAKQDDLGQRHPLKGRIWDVQGRRFTTFDAVVKRLAGARHVTLGEKHDNAQHHLIQARVLKALVRRGRRPAVAWEMFPSTVQPALNEVLKQKSPTAAGIARAVKWKKSGWPSWSIYEPVARAALAARLPMIAAGIQRSELFKAIHGSDGAAARKAAAPALPTAAVDELKKEILESHCGHAGDRMVRMMVMAQQHRDRHMATKMMAAAGGPQGAVLIAGNGHARKDRGVPFYLTLGPQEILAGLGILEVRHGVNRPAAYVHSRPDQPFDFIWFTVRVDNEDPCEKFKKQLQRMKSRHGHASKKP